MYHEWFKVPENLSRSFRSRSRPALDVGSVSASRSVWLRSPGSHSDVPLLRSVHVACNLNECMKTCKHV